MLIRGFALLLLVAGCADVPSAVKTDPEPGPVDVLHEMVREGEISQARAQIMLAALQLEPNQVLIVREVGDKPENVIRSLGVIEDDPPVEMYLATLEDGS